MIKIANRFLQTKLCTYATHVIDIWDKENLQPLQETIMCYRREYDRTTKRIVTLLRTFTSSRKNFINKIRIMLNDNAGY